MFIGISESFKLYEMQSWTWLGWAYPVEQHAWRPKRAREEGSEEVGWGETEIASETEKGWGGRERE